MRLLIAYVAGLVAFFVIDIVWITFMVVDNYRNQLGDWIVEDPRMPAAIGFYLLYVGGLILLAVKPALREKSAGTAWLNGALLGAFGYGAYSFTNYAMLSQWTWNLVWTDVVWGVVLSSLVSFIAYKVSSSRSPAV